MSTTKYVLLGAIGLAAVLLLTSDSTKEMRDDLAEKAKKNAKKWKNRLNSMGSDAADTIADLKDMLSNEIEGLSDDARERIETVLNSSTKAANKTKKNLSRQLS